MEHGNKKRIISSTKNQCISFREKNCWSLSGQTNQRLRNSSSLLIIKKKIDIIITNSQPQNLEFEDQNPQYHVLEILTSKLKFLKKKSKIQDQKNKSKNVRLSSLI